MRIAEFCIKHKVTTILTFIILVIFGLMQFSNLSLALLPDMEIPMSVVYTTYIGASPEDIEELVTRPVESAVASVAGVEKITSTSSENISYVMVQFSDDTDLDEAARKLRDSLDTVSLPSDAADPVVMNINMDMMPVSMIALTGDDLAALQSTAEDNIAPTLERIEGVASVDIAGGVDERIAVTVDTDRMAGYGLTIPYISNCLAADNVLYPGGSVDNGTQTLTVRTDGQYSSPDDVANAIIPLPTGGTVRLSEVATVQSELTDPTAVAKTNKQTCVVLSVNKQSGYNTVTVAEAVNTQLESIMTDYPSLQCSTLMDQSDYINLSVKTAIENIILGVLIAALVLALFLRRFGATLTIAISMPVCIITVFLLMSVFHLTLNMMSLGGIGMGVGMIVDNSIVVLENIFRYRSDGKGRMESCIEGTKEVTGSVIGGTLTTVAVFLPISFTSGMVGQMFRDFSLTIAFLLLASLLIALTLVPLLCYYLLGDGTRNMIVMSDRAKRNQLNTAKMESWYQRTLYYFLRHRGRAVLISVALLVVFSSSLLLCDVTLIPDMDQGQIDVSISMPTGSELDQTVSISDRVAAIAEETVPEIDTLYYQASDESTTMGLLLVPLDQRDRSAAEISDALRDSLQDIAGCEITVSSNSMTSMMSSSNDISLSISGRDQDTLELISNDLVNQISALPDAIEVSSSLQTAVPQVNLHINRANASRYGLTAATIGAAVRSELTGSTATTITIAGKEYDVVLRGNEAASANLDALKSVAIPTATGGTVPLSLVADVDVELAPQTINRTNQSRTVTITANSRSDDSVGIADAVDAIKDSYPLPEGYYYSTDNTMDDIVDSFSSLLQALVIAIGLVYFVLASQFESFVMPIIIMVILPLSFVGGLFGLPITGQKLSIVALVALIILAGTVVNASIVLVDYINTRRSRGEDKNTAILNACPRRVRPVLMTTLTTILGLLPMAFSSGEGAEMTNAMAIVMISGMLISTAVTLFFTPVYYSLIDSISDHWANHQKRAERKRLQRLKKHDAAPTAAE